MSQFLVHKARFGSFWIGGTELDLVENRYSLSGLNADKDTATMEGETDE